MNVNKKDNTEPENMNKRANEPRSYKNRAIRTRSITRTATKTVMKQNYKDSTLKPRI